LVGVTQPGLGVFPTAEVVRIFWPGGPETFSEDRSIAAINPGKTLIVSFRTVPDPTRWRSVLANWQSTGRHIWWVYRHEADLPGDSITPAQYHAAYTALTAPATANSANVHSMTILTGGAVYRGEADQWYIPNVNAIGFDVYYLTNLPRVLTYAHTKGKPVAIPEWGNGTDLVNVHATDDQDLAFAKTYIGLLTPDVFAACWLSRLHNDLSHLPKTRAYLASLV